MSDNKISVLALFLLLLLGCSQSSQAVTPTVTLATLVPTLQSPETPASRATSTVTPTAMAMTTPVATPILEPPAMVFAVEPSAMYDPTILGQSEGSSFTITR